MTKIVLRALEPEDLDLLYTIENDRTLWQVGTATAPYSRYLLHDYMAHAIGDAYADKQVRMVIETENRESVGLVDIFNFSPQHRRAEVGIAVLEAYRQQGIGQQALAQLSEYARCTLRIHQLYAIVSETNPEALALFHAAGFKTKTVLADWIYDGEKYGKAFLLQTFL